MNVKSGYKLCFNFETDFDANADLLPDAKGVRRTLVLSDLHGHWEMDETSLANLRGYAQKIKSSLQKECQP